MSGADAAKLEIAIALFEKGFTENDVGAALQSSNSIDVAVQWLRASGAAPSASVLQPPCSRTPRASASSRRSCGPQSTPRIRSTTSPSEARNGSVWSRQPAMLQSGSVAAISRAGSPGPKMSTQEETCQICFNDVSSGTASRLACRHGFYCSDCLRRHAEARIDAGQIDVPCPECTTKVQERDLRRLLPAALVERLLSRSLERAVSSIEDLRACPTPNCTMRVVVSANEDGRMSCTTCRKTSCVHCGVQPYHRGLTCAEAARRIKRGGAADVERQSRLFQQWMVKTGTKQCPQCHAPVSKQNLMNQETQHSECHKMICLNCSARFCFKCCALLTDTFDCGCSSGLHGFIDPKTGKRLVHLSRAAQAKAKATQKQRAKEKMAKADGRAKAKAKAKAKVSRKAAPAGKSKILAKVVKKAVVPVKAKVKAAAKVTGRGRGRPSGSFSGL